MFTKEIDDLLKGDNLEVLRILAKFNPEKFKDNINARQNDRSFFLSMINRNDNPEYVKGLLELCESFGYDFKQENIMSQQSLWYKNENKDRVPEFIIALNLIRNDESVAFLIEHLGKEYIKKLEEDKWPLLEMVYAKGMVKAIRTFDSLGVNYENTVKHGMSLLNIIETYPKLVDLYWEIVNKKQNISKSEMPEEQFNHYFESFQKKISTINKKRDERIDSIVLYVEEKNGVLSKEQKEKLLIESLKSPDIKIFNSICKLLHLKKIGKELKDLILPHLETIQNHNYIYEFINEDDLKRKITKDGNDIYVIDKVMDTLFKLNIEIKPTSSYDRNSSKNLVNKAFYDRFIKLIKESNILFADIDENETVFSRMASHRWAKRCEAIIDLSPKNKFLFFSEKLNDISNSLVDKQPYTEEQKIKLRELWEQAYLRKDLSGKYVFEKMNLGSMGLDLWLFSPVNLKSEYCVLTVQEQEKLLSYIINSNAHYDIFNNIREWQQPSKNNNRGLDMLKTLYLNLINNQEVNWNNIVILPESEEKKLKDSEFLFELKARKMNQNLNSDLSKKEEFKNNRLKI